MKKTRRIISLIFALLLCLSCSTFASNPRASLYIAATRATINNTADGLEVNFTIMATGIMDELGATTVYIKTASGTPAATFDYTDVGCENMMSGGHATYTSDVTFENPVPGMRYYAVVHFRAGDETGSDSDVYTTSLITAQ